MPKIPPKRNDIIIFLFSFFLSAFSFINFVKFLALPIKPPPRQKASSPYKEELFTRPDWVTYFNRLHDWRQYCKSMLIPKVILPDKDCPTFTYKEKLQNVEIDHKMVKHDLSKNTKDDTKKGDSKYQCNRNYLKYNNIKFLGPSKHPERVSKSNEGTKIQESNKKRPSVDKSDVSKSPEENQVFDFTFSGLSENQTDPVQYKICGTTLEHV